MNYVSSTNKWSYTIRTAAALFLFGLLLAKTGTAQETTRQRTNFYAITGNGLKDTSWLFGTYHLVKSSYLEQVPAVVRAFKKAKGVTVELVLDSAKSAAGAMAGVMKEKNLSGLLDRSFRDSLDQELKQTLGVGVEQFDQLKPVNVAITLSMVYLVTDPNSPIHRYTGEMIDGYFAGTGKRAGKTITEMETIEEQMNVLFNSNTVEEQATQLKIFLRHKDEMIAQGNELLAHWFSHDLDGMYAVSQKGLNVFGSEEAFLKTRNDKWMKTLPGLLKKESQFIAVGALHLAGPDGLVQQLAQQGYTLTPITL